MDSFCTVPWVQLSTKPNGNYRVCCLMSNVNNGEQGLTRDALGKPLNAGQAGIKEAFNSTEYKNIRQQMLNGIKPDVCSTCWVKESHGLSSKRTVTNTEYADVMDYNRAKEITAADGSVQESPVYFDLRFGNLCNLKCIMCHPASSSQWYNDYGKIWNTTTFKDSGDTISIKEPSNYYKWYEGEHFWNELESYIKSMRQVYLVGGEPMIIEQHFNFLKLCVDRGVAGNIILEYDTNLTKFSEEHVQLWWKFKKIILRVSLDDYGPQNEYIRYPSKWSHIENNLKKLQKDLPNLQLSYSTTYQIMNSLSVVNLWRFLGELTPTRILSAPDYLDVKILPRKTKEDIVKYFKDFQAHSEGIKNSKRVTSYISYVEANMDYENPKALKQFFEYMQKLDEIRGTSAAQVFPELTASLNKAGFDWLRQNESISGITADNDSLRV